MERRNRDTDIQTAMIFLTIGLLATGITRDLMYTWMSLVPTGICLLCALAWHLSIPKEERNRK